MARQPEPVQISKTLLTDPGSRSHDPFGRVRRLPAQQFTDVGARDDHPVIDVEGVACDPGLVRQIGGRFARGDAQLDHPAHGFPLRCEQASIEPWLELIGGKMQRVQNEISSLIDGIGGAMPIYEPGLVEAARGVAQPVADGFQTVE